MKGGQNMTKNQIEYWRNVETKRNNLATEQETNRSNMAKEAETYRSNVAREKETHRANTTNEAETKRHNLATEQISLLGTITNMRKVSNDYNVANKQLQETERANRARETENTRSNMAREEENSRANTLNYNIQKRAQSTASYDASTRRITALEQSQQNQRSNALALSNLAENNRANIAREQENTRSNLANEAIKRDTIRLNEAQLNETRRANRANESLRLYQSQVQLTTSLANTAVNAISATAKLNSSIGRVS